MDASLIVVGDEILAGHVQDANTYFIATRLTHHGHRLRRVAVVGDDPGHIADEVRRCLGEGVEVLFVCGGLGPTHDDRTMEGIAAALGRSLEACVGLAERIEALIARIEREGFAASFGVEGLRKMALAPAGAEVLECGSEVVPAVVVDHDGAHVIVLPGPPRELQTVFTEAVEPRFLEGTGAALWREEITHGFPESVLAEALTDLAARYPSVSIGSYPQPAHVLVRFAGPQPDAQGCAEAFREVLRAFEGSDEGRRLSEYLTARRAARERS